MPYKDLEKKRENDRKYYQKNKEKKKEYLKEYKQTEQGKKSGRIKNWKHYGLIHNNYDELYEYYLNTTHCEKCNIELTDGNKASNRKCMDHSHTTGQFRNILCNGCNVKRKEETSKETSSIVDFEHTVS